MQPRVYGPYQHRDRWRVHIIVGNRGTRTTRYRSFDTWEKANAYVVGASDQAQGHTVGRAVTAVLDTMRESGCAGPTIDTARFRLHHFFGLPANEARPLRWLTNRGAELYAAARVKRSADTHHAELALAKQLGALCLAKRWLRVDPFEHIEPIGRKRHGSTKSRLRVDESRKLMAWCLEHTEQPRAVVTLAYLLLGARASEIVKRDVRDLDDGGRLLWINRTKTTAGTRRLILPDELRAPLLALASKNPDAPLIVNEDGNRVTRRWASYHVQAVCKEAGVPVVTPQALRRTWSDVAEDAGESALVVARHLGHMSASVADRSYRDRQSTNDARGDRALRVIAGGKR